MVMGAKQPESFEMERARMVDQQIRRRGITDPHVLAAMSQVPRHFFVDPTRRELAYEDHPLPIGEGQTISQPYMVALMTELCDLRPDADARVLEVGAGSGYQTAILAVLSAHVYAMELVESLAMRARQTLSDLGMSNVTVAHRDGSSGWHEHAPYQAIIVAAGAPSVPLGLLEQLDDGGHLVIPVGQRDLQVLQRITKSGEDFRFQESTACRFVDLRGEYGWDDTRSC